MYDVKESRVNRNDGKADWATTQVKQRRETASRLPTPSVVRFDPRRCLTATC